MSRLREILDGIDPTAPNIAANTICSEISLCSKEALMTAARTLLDAVLADTVEMNDDGSRRALRGDTYADLCLRLKSRAREFRNPGHRRPFSLRSAVVHFTQDVFTEIVATGGDCGEAQTTALAMFIGRLYVRSWVALKVVVEAVGDLVGRRAQRPAPLFVRAACELVLVAGPTLDESRKGETHVSQILTRLIHLVATGAYDQETCHLIRVLAGRRLGRWPAAAGTQLILQLRPASLQEAVEQWHLVKRTKRLPPEEMHLPGPKAGIEDEEGLFRVACVMASGQVVAVLLNSIENLYGKLEASVGIHESRLVITSPTGVVLPRG